MYECLTSFLHITKQFFLNVGATQEKPQPADRSKFHRKVNHIVLFLKQRPHTCGFMSDHNVVAEKALF